MIFALHASIYLSIYFVLEFYSCVRVFHTIFWAHWICLRRSFPRNIAYSFSCLFTFIDDTPDQLNGSTNDSTFSIIISIPIVGQIYRATSANTINFISITSFHICCFFHNCCASCFPFHFHLFPLSRLTRLLYEVLTLLCGVCVCFFRIYFLLLCLFETNALFNIIFCHLP